MFNQSSSILPLTAPICLLLCFSLLLEVGICQQLFFSNVFATMLFKISQMIGQMISLVLAFIYSQIIGHT